MATKYQDVVQDRAGNAVAGAVVKVYATGTSNLSTIYSDNGITTINQSTSPVTSDDDGDFAFYVADGTYDITVTASGFDVITQSAITIAAVTVLPTSPTWTGGAGAYATADDITLTGQVVFSSGAITSTVGLDIDAGQANFAGDVVVTSGLTENAAAVAALDVATDTASLHTKTVSAPTTFTFSTRSLTGAEVISFSLEITNSGGAQTITWPASVKWPSATIPTPTTGVDVYTFYTRDDGTTWRGALVGSYTS